MEEAKTVIALVLCPVSQLWDLFKQVPSAQWSDIKHVTLNLSYGLYIGRRKDHLVTMN